MGLLGAIAQLDLNFLAGFGSLCVVPQLVFPFLVSEAIMGMAFPLFVLMACEADPSTQYQAGTSGTALLLPCST